MNSNFVQMLSINFQQSWKRFGVIASAVFALAMAYFLSLPQIGQPGQLSQSTILGMLPISGSTVTVILGFVAYYLSIHPQGLPSASQVLAQQSATASITEAAQAGHETDTTTKTPE